MEINLSLPLPEGWKHTVEVNDEDGTPVTHFEAYLPNDKNRSDEARIDLYIGEMPPETSAEDEAFYNYADMIGWDENDPEDQDPITVWPFNGKKAYGFEGLSEAEEPLRLMCIEIKQGVLAVMMVLAKDDETLVKNIEYIEKKLRVKVVK